MAHLLGVFLSDESRTLTVLNDSGTTAINAGDLVYSAANDNAIGATGANVKSNYAAGDVKVKSIVCSNAGYKTILGVAITDIGADDYGTIALEGLFAHSVTENVEAGNAVQAEEGTSNALQLNDMGTTAGYNQTDTKIGRALTGGSTDGNYIIWKLSL